MNFNFKKDIKHFYLKFKSKLKTKTIHNLSCGLLTLLFTFTIFNKSFYSSIFISNAVALTPKSSYVQKYTKSLETNKIVDSPASLTQAGKQNYQNQQFTEAIVKWQQARKILISRNDTINEAMVLGNLAQAYQKLGKFTEAHKAIAKSIELLSSSQQDNQSLLADTLNIQGSLKIIKGAK